MVYGYVHTAEIGQLSRYVRDCEAEPDDSAPEVNLWEGNIDEAAHPLVLELNNHDKNGVSAALAYLAEGSTSDVPALIKWMIDGAFKGHFDSDAEFCKDQFTDAVDDHFATWDKRADIGLPEVELSSLINWEEVAWVTVFGQVMNRDDQIFYSIEASGGVYVFDMSIPFVYSEEEE